jgi:Mlc titration factor MtfA (ptsG expression regulator)
MFDQFTAADRRELEGHIQVFVAEKYFEGCNGLRVTEEMRVLIAAQACVLLLHRDTDYFPLMRSVLIYPGPFVGEGKSTGPGGVITESEGWRRGESWHTPNSGGPVVLSWPDVLAGAANPHDGRNVVMHEFAHQLDGESGWVDGAPRIDEPGEAAVWKRTMTDAFNTHVRAAWSGLPTVIDPYGATSPAEFFATATEAFFERPADLKLALPELYSAMSAHFKQDPAANSCFAFGSCRLAAGA